MISEKDIWRLPKLLVKRHGADAAVRTVRRADDLLAAGDIEGRAVWKWVMRAVAEVQRTRPFTREHLW